VQPERRYCRPIAPSVDRRAITSSFATDCRRSGLRQISALDDDDDPTIGLKSGKARASRESGGFLPWSDEDMARYRTKWPLGTEARLMFNILHYTFFRLGDAYRPPHLRQIAVQIATEKSGGNTTVTVPVHPEFADSLCAARAVGIIGADVFTGKLVKDRVLPMNKKAWAAKFKKYAVLADVNERLPWGSQSAGRGCGLRRLHGEPDDGDGRLDRPEDASALHRQGEPRETRHERHGQSRGVRSEPFAGRSPMRTGHERQQRTK
jgi:hypothetical protein